MSQFSTNAMDSRALLADLAQQTEWIRSLARRLVRDAAEAEDVAQEVLVVAQRSSPEALRGDVSGTRAWLARVTRNLSARSHRQQRTRREREANAAREDRIEDHATSLAEAEAHRELLGHVMALDEVHRQALIQRYFRGRRPSETARLEERSLASVSSQLTRAHAVLRRRLEAHGGEGRWLAALLPLLRSPVSLASRSKAGLSGGALLALEVALTLLVAAVILFGVGLWSDAEGSRSGKADSVAPLLTLEIGEGRSMRSTAALVSDADDLAGVALATEEQRRAAKVSSAVEDHSEEAHSAEANSIESQVDRLVVTTVDALGDPVPDQYIEVRRADAQVRTHLGRDRSRELVYSAQTDHAGRATIEGVSPGHYSVGLLAGYPSLDDAYEEVYLAGGEKVRSRRPDPAVRGCPYSVPLHVEGIGRMVRVELRVHRSLGISGRVHMPGEGDMSEIDVFARRSGTSGRLRTACRRDGSFRFDHTLPGDYSFSILDGNEEWTLAEPVQCEAGAEGVELVLARGGRVSGRLLHPVEGSEWTAWITVLANEQAEAPGAGYSGTVRSSDGGVFDFGELESGPYRIAAYTKDGLYYGALDSVSVTSGVHQSELAIELMPAFSITLVSEKVGFGVSVMDGAAEIASLGVTAGRTRVLAVPPGTYTLVIDPAGSAPESPRTIAGAPGDAYELVR